MDTGSAEVIYEGLRLLASIKLFGGSLALSRICVSIAQDEDNPLLPKLEDALLSGRFGNISIDTSGKRYAYPNYAPSLNKLQAFRPLSLEVDYDNDYLLYLDADIFVANDPVPLLSAYLLAENNSKGIDEVVIEGNVQSRIYCGRPWNTFEDMDLFDSFLAIPYAEHAFFEGLFIPSEASRYPLMETIAGGLTYNGMCNTGMYFMPVRMASLLQQKAFQYLDRAQLENERYSGFATFSKSYFGIDSVILWAAQYALHFEVTLVSPLLNYIASAENYLYEFIERHREDVSCDYRHLLSSKPCQSTQSIRDENRLSAVVCTELGTSCNVNSIRLSSEGESSEGESSPSKLEVFFIHFSKGSHLYFKLGDEQINAKMDNPQLDILYDDCFINMHAKFRDSDSLLLHALHNKILDACSILLELLYDFSYHNTTRAV